jgi:glycosyltransferase involved in cell wall biosynthesis
MQRDKQLRNRIIFVSTMAGDPWGGSEELWSQTALNLAAQGFSVCASVHEWSPPHKRVLALLKGGVDVWVRPSRYSIWKHAWRKVTSTDEAFIVAELRKQISTKAPSLVVLSTGMAFPPIELLELCISEKVPFVTIGQANQEAWWPADDDARRYRNVLPAALRCYFVSKANLRLAEKQVGCAIPNAEVVWNPFNIEFSTSLAWPPRADGEVLFACVGRLHPASKGQDILLEAFAAQDWADRNWRLTFYGEGQMKDSLERLVQRLGLGNRVKFGGHASVEGIWASNHVLALPSRYEGLPLVMVEAMLCGRPVVATNVAGHPEVIEDGVVGFLAEAPTVASVAKALERLWERRSEVEQMGKTAAARIRQLVPPDPIHVFSEKIKKLVGIHR